VAVTIHPSDRIDDAITYHDGLAPAWDARYASGGFGRRAAFFRASVLPLLDRRGRDWLDAGCGSGFFSRMIAEDGASVCGVDGSAAMIEAARSHSLRSGANRMTFQVVPTVEVLAFPDCSFDGALCLSVLEYLREPERCLAELVRVAKPGGQIVASFANARSTIRRLQQTRRSLTGAGQGSDYLASSNRTWTRADVSALAAAHKLTGVKILGFDPVLPPFLQSLLSPSLYYLVGRKPDAAPAHNHRPER
jgi:2-polyprenyl-3-methyl-5-hydroxy-6-metoxy-1,4-benzoquinol methylase